MTLIINLFSGPGSGKSTIASGLFSKLKFKNINCELVSEWIKEKVYSGFDYRDDQLYIFAKQNRKLEVLKDKVDIVICDSPILLSLVYANDKCSCYKEFCNVVFAKFNSYNNYNFFYFKKKRILFYW